MSRMYGVVAVLLAVVVAVALSGCGAVRTVVGSDDAPARYGELAPPAKVDTVTVAVGKSGSAGPWTLTARKVEVGKKFGRLVADDGKFVVARVTLANSSEETVSAMTADFVLANKDSFTQAITGDRDYEANYTLGPGDSVKVNVAFFLPEGISEKDMRVAFQNAARALVRFEIPVD